MAVGLRVYVCKWICVCVYVIFLKIIIYLFMWEDFVLYAIVFSEH